MMKLKGPLGGGGASAFSSSTHLAVRMQESEYTTDGRESHASPGGTSRSDISPHQMTGKLAFPLYACTCLCVAPSVAVT